MMTRDELGQFQIENRRELNAAWDNYQADVQALQTGFNRAQDDARAFLAEPEPAPKPTRKRER